MKQKSPEAQSTTPENGFRLHMRCSEGLSLIRVAGAIAIEHCEAFETAMLRLAPRIDGDVLLELSDLRFINVVGLGVIVRLGGALRSRGGRLALSGANPRICRLIRQVRLHELFPPIDTRTPDALRLPITELATCA